MITVRPLGWGFYLCIVVGVALFFGCITLGTTALGLLFVWVPVIDWAYMGVFFAFVVLPLLAVWVAINFQEQSRPKKGG